MASINLHHALAATFGAEQQGHVQSELFLQAGIANHSDASSTARVSDLQMTRLVQAIWRLTKDEFMGFTLNLCKPGTFAFMLNCINANNNLLDALQQGTQFYNLITEDIKTEIKSTDKAVSIEFSFTQPELDPDHFFHEFWFVIWHRLACWLTGVQIPLLEVHFCYPKPEHAKELKLMFPCRHKFGQSQNKLTFDASFAHCELIRSKNEIVQFLDHSPFDLLTIPGFDLSTSTEVKQCLLRSYNDNKGNNKNYTKENKQGHPIQKLGLPTLEQVANELNLSQPTLHRRLKQEGLSFQVIKDELMKDLAIELLTKQKMPVYEIAERVGFSDARSLTRAFKKWTGLTPREYSRLSNKN